MSLEQFRNIVHRFDEETSFNIKPTNQIEYDFPSDYPDEWIMYYGKAVRLNNSLIYNSSEIKNNENISNDEIEKIIGENIIVAYVHKDDEFYDVFLSIIEDYDVKTYVINWETGEILDEVNFNH